MTLANDAVFNMTTSSPLINETNTALLIVAATATLKFGSGYIYQSIEALKERDFAFLYRNRPANAHFY